MKLINGVLFAVLMLFAMSVRADMVARDQGGNSVTLHEQPCVSEPWLKEWKTATMFYQGKQYAVCWRLQGDTVMVLDSAGDVTPVPMFAFKPVTSV